MRTNLVILAAVVLLGAAHAQEYGQRIGRRTKQNFGLELKKSSSATVPVTSAQPISKSTKPSSKPSTKAHVTVTLRSGRTDVGYSYVPPANPLLLPSSSNHEEQQHKYNTAVKGQPSEKEVEVIEQTIVLPELDTQEVLPNQEWPSILADQQGLTIVQQPAPPAPVVPVAPVKPLAPVSPSQQQSIDDEIAFWDFRESIPGDPEIDYPILDRIPQTSFRCNGQRDGYYADIETRCQVFHVCANVPDGEPIKASFLCPNGTIFNQEVFVCQWWPDVDCATSPQFYDLNRHIGVVPESAKAHGATPSHS